MQKKERKKKEKTQGNKRLNFMRKVCIMLQLFFSFRVQSVHFHSMKLHHSSKFLLHVLLHFVLFPLHMLFISVSHFFGIWKVKKKSLVEKFLPKNEHENVGEGARVALKSTSHTQSGRSKHFRVSDGKPNISYYSFSPSHPSFSVLQSLSNMGRFVHSVTVCGQQTNFTSANNHFVAYDHKLPVSQTYSKWGSFLRYFWYFYFC